MRDKIELTVKNTASSKNNGITDFAYIPKSVANSLDISSGEYIRVFGNNNITCRVETNAEENCIRVSDGSKERLDVISGDKVDIQKVLPSKGTKVVLSPLNPNNKVELSGRFLRTNMENNVVTVNDVISANSFSMDDDFPFFEDMFKDFGVSIKLKIMNVEPSKTVKICKKTNLEIDNNLNSLSNKERLIKYLDAVKVKNSPKINDKIELYDLKQVAKLSSKRTINFYEDEDKILLFTEKYYLEIESKDNISIPQ